MSSNTDRAPRPLYNYVAFATPEIPAYFNPQKPDAAAVQLAQELFGVPPTDFNPKHGGASGAKEIPASFSKCCSRPDRRRRWR